MTALAAGAVADVWGARIAFAAAGVLIAGIAMSRWRSFSAD